MAFFASQRHTLQLGEVFKLLLTTLYLEDKHRIIDPGFLNLNRCKWVALYLVDLSSLSSRRYLDGGITCLGIRDQVGRDEGGWLIFKNMSMVMFPADTLKSYHDYTTIGFIW